MIFASLFRTLSRNVWKRQKENLQFLEATRPIRSAFSLMKKNAGDKEHKYFSCPHCHQTVPACRGDMEGLKSPVHVRKQTFERKS